MDDDRLLRQAVERVFASRGFEVEGYDNGRDALTRLTRGAPLPDVVLLDLVMPVMDGSAFLAEIGRDPRLRRIPVVATSGATLAAAARALGAVDFLAKPFTAADALRIVTRHCRPAANPTSSTGNAKAAKDARADRSHGARSAPPRAGGSAPRQARATRRPGSAGSRRRPAVTRRACS